MAEFNAGIARAIYELDTAKAEQSLARTTKSTLEYESILKRVIALGKGGLGGVGGGGGAGGASQANTAALAQQKLALAQQQTARSAAQTATEQQKLATEEQRTAQATARAEQAQLRLNAAQRQTSQNGGKGPALPRTLDGLTGSAAQVALGFISITAAQKGLDFLRVGAQASDAKRSLDSLAISSHTTGDALLSSLRSAAQGTIKDSALIQSANRGIELTQGRIIQSLPRLIEIARAAAKSTGEDVGGLFDSLVKGISRGSPRLIDNANIVISESDAYATFAKQIGKSTDQLTDQEKQTATLNAVLKTGGDLVKTIGLDANSSATQIDRAVTAVQNLGEALATKIAPHAGRVAEGLTNILNTGSLSPEGAVPGAAGEKDAVQGRLISQAGSFEDYAKRLRNVNDQVGAAFANNPIDAWLDKQFLGLNQLNPVEFAYAQSLIATGTATAEAIKQARALGDVSDSLTSQTQGTDTALQALIPKMAAAASGSSENAGQVLALNSAYLQGQISIDVLRLGIEGIIRAQDQAQQAAFQEERETRNLGRSFAAIVPQANAAANAIAGVAGAAGSLPKHINDTSGFLNDGQLKGVEDAFAGHLKRQQDISDARFDLSFAKAKGNAAKIALLRQKEAGETDPVKRLGIERQIVDLQNTSDKAASTAAGKGLSADTRADLKLLSDKQDRLNEINHLLAAGHLTELARKQLLIEQADLEGQISDEIDKRNRAAVDAALGINQDAQKRLKEAREAAGLQRELGSNRFSESEKNVARLRLEEIQLEQQKRQLDIRRDVKEAGATPAAQAQQQLVGTPLAGTPTAPFTPGVPLGPIAGLASAQVNLSLTIQLDPTTGQATVVNAPPNVNILGVLIKTGPGA